MTRDEIISMALDVGLYSGNPRVPGTGNMILTRLQRFANLVSAKEREACAKICKDRAEKNEAAAQECLIDESEKSSLRSAAWQLTVCAQEMMKRGNQ